MLSRDDERRDDDRSAARARLAWAGAPSTPRAPTSRLAPEGTPADLGSAAWHGAPPGDPAGETRLARTPRTWANLPDRGADGEPAYRARAPLRAYRPGDITRVPQQMTTRCCLSFSFLFNNIIPGCYVLRTIVAGTEDLPIASRRRPTSTRFRNAIILHRRL